LCGQVSSSLLANISTIWSSWVSSTLSARKPYQIEISQHRGPTRQSIFIFIGCFMVSKPSLAGESRHEQRGP
jgi:hypothetical protein